jgi:lipoprotein signal peptidase
MQNSMAWVLGIVMAALVLLGLVMASHAADPFMYYIGLGFCLFGVLFNYGMISRHSGH